MRQIRSAETAKTSETDLRVREGLRVRTETVLREASDRRTEKAAEEHL